MRDRGTTIILKVRGIMSKIQNAKSAAPGAKFRMRKGVRIFIYFSEA
jgi:hypothetical protein